MVPPSFKELTRSIYGCFCLLNAVFKRQFSSFGPEKRSLGPEVSFFGGFGLARAGAILVPPAGPGRKRKRRKSIRAPSTIVESKISFI